MEFSLKCFKFQNFKDMIKNWKLKIYFEVVKIKIVYYFMKTKKPIRMNESAFLK